MKEVIDLDNGRRKVIAPTPNKIGKRVRRLWFSYMLIFALGRYY